MAVGFWICPCVKAVWALLDATTIECWLTLLPILPSKTYWRVFNPKRNLNLCHVCPSLLLLLPLMPFQRLIGLLGTFWLSIVSSSVIFKVFCQFVRHGLWTLFCDLSWTLPCVKISNISFFFSFVLCYLSQEKGSNLANVLIPVYLHWCLMMMCWLMCTVNSINSINDIGRLYNGTIILTNLTKGLIMYIYCHDIQMHIPESGEGFLEFKRLWLFLATITLQNIDRYDGKNTTKIEPIPCFIYIDISRICFSSELQLQIWRLFKEFKEAQVSLRVG